VSEEIAILSFSERERSFADALAHASLPLTVSGANF
jgi:hypothetical protein